MSQGIIRMKDLFNLEIQEWVGFCKNKQKLKLVYFKEMTFSKSQGVNLGSSFIYLKNLKFRTRPYKKITFFFY